MPTAAGAGGTATSHRKTAAQAMLRWHIHNGVQAIAKSVKPQRIAENFEVFDFEGPAAGKLIE